MGNVDWDPSEQRLLFDGYERGESSEEIIHRFQKRDYLASEEKQDYVQKPFRKRKNF